MTSNQLVEVIQNTPVISAVRDIRYLDEALKSQSDIVFILIGDIMNIESVVLKCHEHKKIVFVHLDLIKGFSRDVSAIRFIKEKIKSDGVISTKNSLLKAAKSEGLFTILRIFMLDSSSFDIAIKSVHEIRPDAVEIMPGVVPKAIEKACSHLNVPIIAGGLIENKKEVVMALKNGATGISTTDIRLWNE